MGKYTGQKYRPSNGTDGMIFEGNFCSQCIHEKFYHTQNHADKQCDIFNRAFCGGEHVDEWVYDENDKPTCTSFVKHDWGPDDDGNWNEPPEPIPYDPNQLVLPFAFEELENQKVIKKTLETVTH